MAVFRVNKTADYTVISNTHFKEREMSLKAKGMLSLMLSLPDEWDYSINGLSVLSKDGKESVMNALAELEDFGYLKRTKVTDSNGRFAGYDYDIFEKPQTESPYTEKPNTETPNTENPPQLNTKQSKTKKSNKKKSNTKEFVPPTLEDIQNYCKERNNNVDAKKFFDYFSASDWVDSKGNPVRNWKQKVITWEGYNNEKPKMYGRKEPTPGWLQGKHSLGSAEVENIKRLMAEEPATVGTDPDLAERAEKLRQSLGG